MPLPSVFYARLYAACYKADGYWHGAAGAEDMHVTESHGVSRDPDRAMAHALRELADRYEERARANATRAALADAEIAAARVTNTRRCEMKWTPDQQCELVAGHMGSCGVGAHVFCSNCGGPGHRHCGRARTDQTGWRPEDEGHG